MLDHSTFWVSLPELVSWITRSAINLGASLCLHYPLCEWQFEVAPTLLLRTVRMSGRWEINFMLLKYKIIDSWYPHNEHKWTFELQEFRLERLSEIILESQEWHRAQRFRCDNGWDRDWKGIQNALSQKTRGKLSMSEGSRRMMELDHELFRGLISGHWTWEDSTNRKDQLSNR